jgi:tetratricopeptide (TPR) repeat protein
MKKTAQIALSLLFAVLLLIGDPLLAQKEPEQKEKGTTPKKEQASALFLKAKEDFAKKDLDRAEVELRGCLEAQPGYADALLLLAQVDYSKGDYAQALVEIQKAEAAHAAAAEGQNTMTAERRKELLAARTEKEQEIAFLGGILYSDTCKSDVQRQRLPEEIDSLRREISFINAVLSQQQISEPLPLPADYSHIHGNIFFKMNRFQEAGSEYLKAIAADPGHLPAYNNLVNLCYVTRDFEKVLKFIDQAEASGVEINPKLKEAVVQIVEKRLP